MLAVDVTYFGLFSFLIADVSSISGEISVSDLTKVIEEAKNVTPINVCDETNTNNSYIYCYGKILESVNVHNLFKDSKTFVDMPMKNDPEVTLKEFDRRFGKYDLENIDRTALQTFIDEYFEPAGAELQECELKEWVENPPKIMMIRDPALREWALQLHALWKKLCRKVKSSIDWNRNSLIYVPEEFIIPGGRFREYYYWDAYWIVKGLAASGLQNAIKKMIVNFVSLVDRYGFVPNGGRIYYLSRSQPPMLIPMVYEYFELTQDIAFIREILPKLIQEYEFWEQHRTNNVTDEEGDTHSLFQYHTTCNIPRPESFRVDIVFASHLPAAKRPKFYMDIASAAESGWDFSSRWFADKRSIETIETTDVIPIDLNAFICWNMQILQYLLKQTGNYVKSKMFRDKREELRNSMVKIFYNQTEGAWFDYNLRTRKQNINFYPAVAVPLFGECYQPLNLARPQRIVEYLNRSGVYDYPGGVPTSLINTTAQQWDFPNGWSPLNHMIIEGMRKSSNPVVQEQAYRLAKKWILGNYKVFRETGHMWEKYNVIGDVPQPGSGGEYDVQDGFGWSNGVILDLLTTYYDRMRIEADDSEPDNADSGNAPGGSYVTAVTTTILFTLIVFLLKH